MRAWASRAGAAVVVVLVAIALVVIPGARPAYAGTISSPGPLTNITISPDLNCSVNHALDALPEWYGTTACGTFASLNGTLFGPANVPAGNGASPRTSWTPVSQSPITGTGTQADPFRIETVVQSSTGVRFTQVDTYVVGREFYDTSLRIDNTTPVTQIGNLYTAGDCYLGSSDVGYGKVFGTSPACSTSTLPGARVEQLIPRTGDNAYMQAAYSSVWARIGQQLPFPNTCLCSSYIDNGIGISWPLSVGPGTSATYEWTTAFSPTGVVPIAISAVSHIPAVLPGASDGYTIRIGNPNADPHVVDTVTVVLPPGFTYTPGSTTGATTADPVINGSTLTFTGPFAVPAAGQLAFDFGVTVSSVPGDYTIDATGTATGIDVVGTTGAALITVLAVADISVTKTSASTTAVAGGAPIVFTVTAANDGPGVARNVEIRDPLPAGMTFVAGASSAECFLLSGEVRCALPQLDPGGSHAFTIALQAAAGASGGRTNSVAITADVDDPDLSDNTASAGFTIQQLVDMSVTKTAAATAAAGGPVTYTIVVRNAGPSTANWTLTDALPGGVAATSMTGPGCTLAGGPRCSGVLNPGASANITLVGTISPITAAGTALVNTATVTSTQQESAPANNTATATVTVTRSADLAIAKSPTTAIVPGKQIGYSLNVSNIGPSYASNVVVTDTPPAGTTFDPNISSSSCSFGNGVVTCTAPLLAPGSSLPFLVGFVLSSSTAGGAAVSNSASVTAAEPDPVLTNNTSTTTTAATRQVDLVVSKTTLINPVPAGNPTSFSIVVRNDGPSDATGVVVTDPVIAGATFTDASVTAGQTGTCTVDSAEMRCDIPSLPAGTSSTITLNAIVDANRTDPITNVVTAASIEPELTPTNNTATDSATVAVQTGLEISKSDGGVTAIAGGALEYTLSLINRGPSTATGVSISDALPPELLNPTFSAPAGVTCDITSGTLSCTVPDLPPDLGGAAPVVVTVSGTLDPLTADGATIDNVATATDSTNVTVIGPESTPVERQSTFTVSKAPLTFPVVAGGTLQWSIVATNNGPSATQAPVLIDIPDPGYTITGMSGTGVTCDLPTRTCDLGLVGPTESRTILVTGTVSVDHAAGPLTNRVTLDNPDGPDARDSATIVVTRVADLVVTKTPAQPTIVAGEPTSFVVEVTNNGPSSASTVAVTDTLPPGLTFDSALSSDGCAANGQDVTCSFAGLGVGLTRALTIAVNTSSSLPPGPLSNTAVADSSEDDPDGATGTATVTVVAQAALSIQKSAPPAVAGEQLTWTAVVTNDGPSDATGVVVTDTLDPRLTIVSADADGTACTISGQDVSCSIPLIAVDADATITIVTTTPSDIVPVGAEFALVDNTATVTAATADPDPDDNTVTATALVYGVSDLVTGKTGPGTAVAGTDITYTLTATNAGPSQATGVEVIDRLDPLLVFDAGASDSRCALTDPGMNEVRCAAGVLAVGDTATFDVVVRVDPGVQPGSQILNAAASQGDQPDPVVQPPATVTTTIEAFADLTIEKSVDSPVTAGEEATYTVVVTNNGPSSATDVTITDTGPARGLTGGLQSGVKGQPACPVKGVRFTCTIEELRPGESVTITIPVGTDPATPDGTVILNTAEVSSSTPETNPDDNTDDASLTIVRRGNLVLDKHATATSAQPGGRVEWVLTVTNQGPSQVDDVTVVDDVPVGLTIADAPSECATAGQTVTCTAGSLPPGGSASFTIGTTIDSATTGSVTNTATASGTGASAEATASATVEISTILPATGVDPGPPLAFGLVLLAAGVGALAASRRRTTH